MNPVKVALYALSALTCIGCTILLAREYFRRRMRLLLWAAVCFVGLSVNNIFLFFDLVLFPEQDLRLVRLGVALIGMLCLLYAFVWETET